ncbi:Hypothetical predicted protein [Xyrichtys novacula]|uniref:Uncharacterized protein n=1 Tax=Xyrichtys novacula TaxID=13765 RepID=A0AAV1FRN5_XYRNO|nr:Hypothetical predicted protein [Xyrichtys novacula]
MSLQCDGSLTFAQMATAVDLGRKMLAMHNKPFHTGVTRCTRRRTQHTPAAVSTVNCSSYSEGLHAIVINKSCCEPARCVELYCRTVCASKKKKTSIFTQLFSRTTALSCRRVCFSILGVGVEICTTVSLHDILCRRTYFCEVKYAAL